MDTATAYQRTIFMWETGPVKPGHSGTLIYRADAPDQIELAVKHAEHGTVTHYKVPRELLSAGLQHYAFWGASTVRPHTMAGWLVVTLPGRGDHYVDAAVVRAFLDATAELAPLEVSA